MILFVFLVGCGTDVPHNAEVKNAVASIEKDLSRHEEKEIHLNALTDFDWDKAFLFSPYTPQESIDETLGVAFKDPSGIDYRDDIFLLVFMKDDQVVQYAKLDCQQISDYVIEFSTGGKEYVTPTNDALFIKAY
jgi:hypothetical protein